MSFSLLHTSLRSHKANRANLVYKEKCRASWLQRLPSPSLDSHLLVQQTIREGSEAGENIVISRPDKPPPEVALIEKQPRHWANRKILSGSYTEPANQHSRRSEAFANKGDVWREETRASPGLLLFLDGLLGEKLDLNSLLEMTERREAFAGAAVVWVRWFCSRSGWRRLLLQTERMGFGYIYSFVICSSSETLQNHNGLILILMSLLFDSGHWSCDHWIIGDYQLVKVKLLQNSNSVDIDHLHQNQCY